MGSASAHNASLHSASTKHGPAHPRDVDDVDERSAHDLDECCASTPRAPHEVVQHGHAQQWHAQQAHATRAQAHTARARAAGTRNTSTGAQARTTRGHRRPVSLLMRSYAPPAAAPPLTYARATHDHSAADSGRPCRGSTRCTPPRTGASVGRVLACRRTLGCLVSGNKFPSTISKKELLASEFFFEKKEGWARVICGKSAKFRW